MKKRANNKLLNSVQPDFQRRNGQDKKEKIFAILISLTGGGGGDALTRYVAG